MLKELEDYNWFPAILRRWQMEFIGSVAIWTKLYRPLIPVLQQMIMQNNSNRLQDTCSGSGIPAVYIHHQLSEKIPLLLTDKYPDMSFKNSEGIVYSIHSVDVMNIEPVEQICYTMFNAFHHFSTVKQKQIIVKMAEGKVPFLIAEILEPGVINIIKISLTTTILQLFVAPFVKPFSLKRLFFTYIIPVNLFTITYDGIISVMRSRTKEQYEEILKNISTRSYSITVNKINNWKGNVVYIKGEPITT